MQKGLERKTRKEKKDRCFIIIVVAIRERVSVVYPHLLAAEPPTIHVLIVVENTNIPHVFRWCALTLIIAVRAEL